MIINIIKTILIMFSILCVLAGIVTCMKNKKVDKTDTIIFLFFVLLIMCLALI
jgi:hypothetical protein